MAKSPRPRSLDPWLASSLLQKAIRRGEIDAVQAAAITLQRVRGNAVWRRLTIIAAEDIGLADEAAAVRVVVPLADKSDSALRCPESLASVVRRLTLAPKNRDAEYSVTAATFHPSYREDRAETLRSPIRRAIRTMANPKQPLVTRAIAAVGAYSVLSQPSQTNRAGQLAEFVAAFEGSGCPSDLLQAVRKALASVRDPMFAVLPILWDAVEEAEAGKVKDTPILPPSPVHNGIPLYAFDKHTYLGKRALGGFRSREPAGHTVLERICSARAMGRRHCDGCILR